MFVANMKNKQLLLVFLKTKISIIGELLLQIKTCTNS